MSDITEDLPFPAEADLAAVASVSLGPVGRFQLRCAGGQEGAAYVIDTTDGRTWRLDGARWVPLDYAGGTAPPAP